MRRRTVFFLILFFVVLSVLSPAEGEEGCCWRKKVQVVGRVVDWRPPLLVIRSVSGGTLYVRLGPYRWWERFRLTLSPGDRVRIKGWLCGRMLIPEVFSAPGGTFRLRDERGWPVWRRKWKHW